MGDVDLWGSELGPYSAILLVVSLLMPALSYCVIEIVIRWRRRFSITCFQQHGAPRLSSVPSKMFQSYTESYHAYIQKLDAGDSSKSSLDLDITLSPCKLEKEARTVTAMQPDEQESTGRDKPDSSVVI